MRNARTKHLDFIIGDITALELAHGLVVILSQERVQGELYISAVDLAKIGMILAGDGSFLDSDSQRVQFLSQQALEQMHTPLVYDPQTNTTRSLAVQMTEDILDGTTLWGHQGNAYGVVSCLFYDRDTRKGVVFLNNRASQMRTESKVYAVNDAVVKAIWQYLG